jgi:hypothetical protein
VDADLIHRPKAPAFAALTRVCPREALDDVSLEKRNRPAEPREGTMKTIAMAFSNKDKPSVPIKSVTVPTVNEDKATRQ